MDLLDAHSRAMSGFDARVRQVRPDQWSLPTQCTDWSVRDLVNHIVAEQRRAPLLLGGATLDQVGTRFDGDQLGDDPLAAWTQAAAAARGAWSRPGALETMVHVRGGTAPAAVYGWQMTTDLAVHGWDLARAIDADAHIDVEVAQTLLTAVGRDVQGRQGLHILAPPVEIPDTTEPGACLVALLGRDPR